MKTTVKARNLELTEDTRAQIDRKLRRLDRVAHPDAEATVELIAHASHAIDASTVAEVTLLSNGSVIRSASAGPNPIAAIDALLDKLERQVVRSKERPRRVREREHDEARNVLVREADGSVADDGGAGAAEEPGHRSCASSASTWCRCSRRTRSPAWRSWATHSSSS